MGSDQFEIEVQLNGESIARVSVPRSATRREMELAAMSHPEVHRRIGDSTIKGFTVVQYGVVNIVV